MDDWDARLQDQVDRDWTNYHRHRFDLTTARTDLFFAFAGDFLYVARASSASAAAAIKFNRARNDRLDLQAGTTIKTVFKNFWLTNVAQSGEYIDVIVGVNFEKMDPLVEQSRQARAVVEITHAIANNNQAGADQIAERVVITASPLNTDIAWIDFGQAAVQDNCYPLEPGDSVTVRTSNLNQINVNFEVGGESVWIINEI